MNFAILILALFCANANAATWYVTQSGAGSGNGSTLGNAASVATENAAPVESAGDTVSWVGPISTPFTTSVAGTVGHPITHLFDTGFTASTLADNSAWITVSGGNNYLNFIGGTFTLTDNGTSAANGGTCTYSHTGIAAIRNTFLATNITIQNLTISNLYNRQVNTDMTDNAFYLSGGIIVAGGSGGNPANWTITNCVINGIHHPISFIFDNSGYSNCTITHCVITNYAYGIGISPVTVGAKFYNISITHNVIQSGDEFENNANWHRNGIVSFGTLSDSATSICMSNFVIAYNNIGTGFHPCLSCATVSGGSSLMSFQQDLVQHLRVYNNIETVANGLTVSGEALWGIDFLYANNTIWCTNDSLAAGDLFIPLAGNSNVFAFNNIIYNNRKIAVYTTTTNHIVTDADAANTVNQNNLQAAYNVFNGNYIGSGQSDYQIYIYTNTFNGALIYDPFGLDNLPDAIAKWPTANLWSNSTTNSVQLGANFVPLANDTVAVGKGMNLTSFGITDDYAGNPRPASGPWTIGAYQFFFQPSNQSAIMSGGGQILVSGGGQIIVKGQ